MALEEGGRMRRNYSFGCGTSKPNGCLLNPEGSRIIFFEGCKRSLKTNLKTHTHLFYTNHLENLRDITNPKSLISIQLGKSGTNFTKKAGKRSLTNTDDNNSRHENI